MPALENPADEFSLPIVAIDLGGKRIGIAVSDSGILATPHSVVLNEGDVVEKLASIGSGLGAALYVVGIPRRTHRSAAERKYEEFAEALRQRTCKPVLLWNESLSTVAASERRQAAGHTRREAQKTIDMHAAAVILQSFLDSLPGRQS
jgi:putative holliday junction resolvase